VFVGNVGSHGRLNFTAMGQAVDPARRIQYLNIKSLTTVLATKEVVKSAGDGLMWWLVDRVAIRGVHGQVELSCLTFSGSEACLFGLRKMNSALTLVSTQDLQPA
jgi:class 3 adenylate cyclase